MSDFLADLDQLGAEGRLTSVMLVRSGDRWQTYIKLGRTTGYSSQCGATPTETLAKGVASVPACEDYDLKNGFGAVDPAKAPVSKVESPKAPADVDDLLG